jgi:hypothetical protein
LVRKFFAYKTSELIDQCEILVDIGDLQCLEELREEILLRTRARKLLLPTLKYIDSILAAKEIVPIQTPDHASASDKSISNKFNSSDEVLLWRQILQEVRVPSARMLLADRVTLCRIDAFRAVFQVEPGWMEMVLCRKTILEFAVEKAIGAKRKVEFHQRFQHSESKVSSTDYEIRPLATPVKLASSAKPGSTAIEKNQDSATSSASINLILGPSSNPDNQEVPNDLISKIAILKDQSIGKILEEFRQTSRSENEPTVDSLYQAITDSIIRRSLGKTTKSIGHGQKAVESSISTDKLHTSRKSTAELKKVVKQALLAYCSRLEIKPDTLKDVCRDILVDLNSSPQSSSESKDLSIELRAAKKEIVNLTRKLERALSSVEKLKASLSNARTQKSARASKLDKPYRFPFVYYK